MPNGTGRIVVALALALLGSCSDGAGPDDVLTDEQAQALLSIVDAKVNESKEEAELGTGGAFTAVVPCLFKGEVATSGKYTEVEDSTKANYDVDMTMVYTKCRQGSDASVFVIEGTVREVSTDKYDLVVLSRALDNRLTGNLDWSLDNASGSCAIDLTLVVRASPTTQSVDVTGTLCGAPFTSS